MNVDLFLEQTFLEAANSQANTRAECYDDHELAEYHNRADSLRGEEKPWT